MEASNPSSNINIKKKDLSPEERENSRSWSYFDDKSDSGFVGLSNQGATCYMNSLLQTLYMTPEFRKALYNWKYSYEKEGPEEDCIPYQLQKLFSYLQLSDKAAIGTKGLTKSFGWNDSESFEQHDIQELNRVLFDALERSFKGTPEETLVNDLYQGSTAGQIICQECNNITSRPDTFLDVPLVIRNVSSLKEALDLYVEPELLYGDNKYQCDNCVKKCDALKGIQFKELPYLLTIQLKRFDIDFQIMERIKINSTLEFPRYIDMSEYIEPELQKQKLDAAVLKIKEKIANNEDNLSENLYSDFMDNPNDGNDPMDMDNDNDNDNDDNDDDDDMLQEIDEEKDEPIDNEEPPEGDNIYELYSILIHSGDANHGHYYAYIKSFTDRTWYNFDDSSVTRLKAGEIEKAFGGDKKNNLFRGSANAYMLVYRKVSKTKNICSIDNNCIPSYLKEKIEKFNHEFAEEKIIHIEKKDKLSIKLYKSLSDDNPIIMNTRKSLTLKEITETIYSEYPEIQELASCNSNIRLRSLDMRKIPGNDYHGKENEKMEDLNIYSNSSFLIESKQSHEEWDIWSPTAMSLQIILWHLSIVDDITNTPADFLITVDQTSTLRDVKELIIKQSPKILRKDHIRIFRIQNRLSELDDEDDRVRNDCRLFNGDKLYVEEFVSDCDNIEESELQSWYKANKDQITLRYNLLESSEFDQEISIDRNATLQELKTRLSEIINVPCDEFKIRQQHTKYSEWKDLSKTLTQVNLSDRRAVHILLGKPLVADEWNVVCSVYKLDKPKDEEAPKFIFPVNSYWTMQELREKLSKEVGIEPNLMRFRDHYSTKLTRIHKGKTTVKESISTLYDGKGLAIEEIEEPEDLQPDDRLVTIVCYNPEKHIVEEPQTILLQSTMTLSALQTKLAEIGGFDEKYIAISKPYSSMDISDPDIVKEFQWKYYKDKEAGNYTLDKFSWMMFDADIFVYKNTSLESSNTLNNNSNTNNNNNNNNNAQTKRTFKTGRPERALKIKVAKEEQPEDIKEDNQ